MPWPTSASVRSVRDIIGTDLRVLVCHALFGVILFVGSMCFLLSMFLSDVIIYALTVILCAVQPEIDLSKFLPTQSSSYSSSYNAENAINGVFNGAPSECSITKADYQSWWSIDLESNFRITSIEITNRADCCGERLDNFVVSVDGIPCASRAQTGEGETTRVACIATGSQLTIRLPNVYQYLQICDLKIFGVYGKSLPRQQ